MGYFPYSTQTVITHQSNSGIRFRLYCISMELSVSLHQRSVISGSLWRSFTRTYSSHQFCPSLRWTSRVWLASSWSCSLEESWMAQICSSLKNSWTASWTLQGSCACSDKWAFSSLPNLEKAYSNKQNRNFEVVVLVMPTTAICVNSKLNLNHH